ncbi:MAG: amidohydrolase [Bacteroidales bacterium]|nr:amidohydrolase [Bacteroidales bacterium]
MNDLKNKIIELAGKYYTDVISWRRHIHANPELSMQEYQTSAYVAERLDEFGIPYQKGVAKTGIVALIKGKNPEKKTIALRADMDALPIIEANEVDYKSKNQGVMHACGHDVHTSSLLGTAKILNHLKDNFEGTVKLFFQPSEERYPGGAIQMIQEGAMENPRPVHVFGQHVYPELEAGKVGFRSGEYMASTDEIFLTVKGRGGHAAQPSRNIDPVLIAAHIIVALQQIVSRFASPDVPTVLSFGRIIGEGQTNVIPNEVKISGTIRTFDEQWRKKAHSRIKNMAQSIAEGMGGSCDVIVDAGYPFVFNDPQITDKSRSWAIELLGEENVVELPIRMTAEDFSYFANIVPSCFYRLGVANEALGLNSSLHSPTFNVDEKSLQTGISLMAWIAVNALLD